MIVSQHSGEGKANQYYLRGFNLDHGTDFSHDGRRCAGQYADRRACARVLRPQFPDPRARQRRAVQEGTVLRRRGRFLGGRRGQRQLRQSARPPALRVERRQRRMGSRASAPHLRASAAGYLLGGHRAESQRWPVGAAGRLPQGQRRAAIQPRRQPQRLLRHRHGLLGRLGLHRPSRRSRDRERPDFALRIPRSDRRRARQIGRASPPSSSGRPGRPRIRATGFLLHNSLNLFSNFTYFLDDPDHGDQFEQAERPDRGRRTADVSAARSFLRAAHRERHRRTAAARLARSGRPLSHRGATAALDDARG